MVFQLQHNKKQCGVTYDHLPLIVALNANNCTISTSNRSISERFRCVGKSKGVDKLILGHLEQI